LMDHLKEHPGIFIPRMPNRGKLEIHYFDKRYIKRSPQWYNNLFREHRHLVCGEKTPSYLSIRVVPGRIKENYPNTKFVVILRNPTDRAYSAYKMHCRKARGTDKYSGFSFESICEIPMSNLQGETFLRINYSDLVSRGLYYYQLLMWFKFFNREQFIIFKSEDFWNEPQIGFDRIHEFLGVEPKTYNKFVNVKDRPYLPMGNDIREQLNELYEPHNKLLKDLVGFSW